MAAKKTPKKSKKAKVFVSESGDRLEVFDTRDGYYIAWIYPLAGDGGLDGEYEEGLIVGEGRVPSADNPPEKADEWENWRAHHTIRALADEVTPNSAFWFETKAKAVRALRAANDALLSGDRGKPWPRWAVQAKEAGWTPPEGWQP